jgi:hypothetical protein
MDSMKRAAVAAVVAVSGVAVLPRGAGVVVVVVGIVVVVVVCTVFWLALQLSQLQ